MIRPIRRTAAAVLLVGAVAACGSGQAKAIKGPLGAYPTFLPADTIKAGAAHQVVDATTKAPALATQGDTVRVHLDAGPSVLATVAGPEVPNTGLDKTFTTSPATWTVTLASSTGTVPVDVSAFNAIDDEGRVYKLGPTVGETIPTSVAKGQTASFRLTAVVATGEGRLRWIPSGHLAPVEWDYVVEID